ncbi:MAG: hypothetical protein PWP64_318 [Candidatus Cloacimonadota bacterium]|nr:hypothetical protein [Candidatus Cloacimonadota bacterium]
MASQNFLNITICVMRYALCVMRYPLSPSSVGTHKVLAINYYAI